MQIGALTARQLARFFFGLHQLADAHARGHEQRPSGKEENQGPDHAVLQTRTPV